MRHFFTILIGVFCCQIIWGQKTIRIFQASDSLPVQGVTARWDKEGKAVSAWDGYISLPKLNDSQVVLFTHASYESQIIIYANLGAYIYMFIKENSLDPIVVSAGKRAQKVSEVPVSMEIMKPQNLIEKSNITKLDAAMDNVPGVNIINGQANIRGGSGFSYGAGSRVMMLVDGLPMVSADAGDIKWDAVPLENIEQVEVIKGAGSALYGSGALNGVIHLKTAAPAEQTTTKVLAFQGIYDRPYQKSQQFRKIPGGSNGLTLTRSGKMGTLGYVISGYILNDDGYRVSENFINKRISLKLTWSPKQLKNLKVQLSGMAFQSVFGNFLYWRNADSMMWPAEGSNSQYRNNRYTLDPTISYKSSKGYQFTSLNRVYITDNHNLTNASQNALGQLQYHEFQVQKSFQSDRFRFTPTAGVVYSRQRVSSDSIYGTHTGRNAGLYIQADLKYKKTNISLGIRREYNKADTLQAEGIPVYRVGLVQQFGKATWVRWSYGTGYRYPSLAERFTNTSGGSVNVFPNPSITPEKGSSQEIGIRQGLRLGAWKGYTDLAWFDTRFENMIDFTFGYYPPAPGIFSQRWLGFKPMNITNARISGWEWSSGGSGYIGKVKLDLMGGYTYMNPVYTGLKQDSLEAIPNGKYLKYRFQHTWKFNLDAEWKQWSIGISTRFVSHMLKIDTIFYQFIPGVRSYREAHHNGYTIADFRLSRQVGQQSKFTLVIKNIFNKEYMYIAGNIGAPRSYMIQYQLIIK